MIRISILLCFWLGVAAGYAAAARANRWPAGDEGAKFVEVLADENASLREQIDVQKKLIYELWGLKA
jgi:hypothetical protein